MTGTYAATTDVPVSRSRDEIERTLTRFGATAYGYSWDAEGVVISFEYKHLRVRMRMQLPRLESIRDKAGRSVGGRRRSEASIEREWEQACRQRWRTLANGVKAKLALVDDGISTVEREFMADVVVTPEGQTVGEWLVPQLAEMTRTGTLPPALPPPTIIELGTGTGR